MTDAEMEAVPGTVREWTTFCLLDVLGKRIPEGPWTAEPNKVQWVDAATGLPCLIVRAVLGHLCGYAGVYPGNPYHGRHFRDISGLSAHGSVNYSQACDSFSQEGWGVCHVPEPESSDDVWWFGFDCGHAFDLQPVFINLSEQLGHGRWKADLEPDLAECFTERYRDLSYVRRVVADLAAQLKAAQTL